MKRPLLVAIAVGLLTGVFMTAVFWGCASEQDADRIAQALADRLTDALDFEDSPAENPADTLPEENAGNAAFPQVTALAAPTGLRSGESFTLRVLTDYSNTADIAGAIVYVKNSGKYLDFSKGASSSGVIELNGRMREISATDPDPADPLQWLEGRSFKLEVAMRNSGMEGTPGIGNFRPWQINLAQTQEDLNISHLCEDICAYLERCGAEWGQSVADGQAGHEDPYNFAATEEDYCLGYCRSEEAAVKAGSSQACWSTVEAYAQCLFNLPCEEYAITTGEWYEQGENACRLFSERMEQSCQDSEWYQDAFGTDRPYTDPNCEPACGRLIGCGYYAETDLQECMDSECTYFSAAELSCIAGWQGECYDIITMCEGGGDADTDLDLDIDTDTDTDVVDPTACTNACVLLVESCQLYPDGDTASCERDWCPQWGTEQLQCVISVGGECDAVMIEQQCGVTLGAG